MKLNTLRKYISQSGLFLEGTESVSITSPINSYSGFNVTKTNDEPIDQIQTFIVAKRIQDWNQQQFGNTGTFIPFIAGLFEILNANNLDAVNQIIDINTPKEKTKQKLYFKIITKFNLNTQILLTKDLWQDTQYWEILQSILDQGDFTRGNLINDTLRFYSSKDQLFSTIKLKDLPSSLFNLPLDFIKKFGNWPSAILYTPTEVAEALYFLKKQNTNCKIGQAQERVYDKYLINQMTTIRLRQPVDLLSKIDKPQTVTPYIDKQKDKPSSRIYFNDDLKTLTSKINQIVLGNYCYLTDPIYGEILNPLIEKAVFAIESALCQGEKSVTINSISCSSGQELIDNILCGQIKIESIKSQLPRLIFDYILSLSL